MTNKISEKEVEHIARLSRLSLEEAQKNNFTSQLGDVLLYVEQLTEKEFPPSRQEEKNALLREDVVGGPSVKTSKLLENVPQKIETNIKVPLVLGGEGG